MNINKHKKKKKRGYCVCGTRTTHQLNSDEFQCKECYIMGLEDKLKGKRSKSAIKKLDDLSPEEKRIANLIRKSHLGPKEIEVLLKSKQRKYIKPAYSDYFDNKKHLKFGIIPDMHIGSKYHNKKVFDLMVQKFNKDKVDAVYCVGDIMEGMSMRDGHIYELEDIGYAAQLKTTIEQLKKIKQPFRFITGNHDLWFKSKTNMGIDPGKDIADRVPNSKYLGEMEATVELSNGVKMWLTHRGNSSYALSYSGQKMINGINPGEKPDIILNGHLHKSLYMYYRGIHYLETGVLQNQTEFMKMKGSPAMVGFWTIELELGKKGLVGFKPTWYGFDHLGRKK